MTTSKARSRLQSPKTAADLNLARRLKAAGLEDATEPKGQDIDSFRNRLARKIAMITNTWRGCPEPSCKRFRGCMAPNGSCTNAPDEPWDEAEWDQARFDIRQALDERIAELKASGEWKDE